MVPPTGTMCIRTLPRKKTAAKGGEVRDSVVPTEHFGVAKYAAAFQKAFLSNSNHLLSGVSVLLCGSSASSGMTKDLKVLLLQAGATISSVSTASRSLTKRTSSEEGEAGVPPLFVFLCDSEKDCGISEALFQQAKELIVAKEEASLSLLCVHFNWLFDSISCAAPMEADAYKPLAPRPKALWGLLTKVRKDA